MNVDFCLCWNSSGEKFGAQPAANSSAPVHGTTQTKTHERDRRGAPNMKHEWVESTTKTNAAFV